MGAVAFQSAWANNFNQIVPVCVVKPLNSNTHELHLLYTSALNAMTASKSCADAAAGPDSSLHCPGMALVEVIMCNVLSRTVTP